MVIVKEEDKNVPLCQKLWSLMPLPDSDLGLGTLESVGCLKESIHPLPNKVGKK